MPDLLIYVQVIERPRAERRQGLLYRFCRRLRRALRRS